MLKGLIHRAHQLCDLKEDLLNELQLLRDVFVSNGYPRKLVERTINNSWKVEFKKEIYALLHEEDILHQSEEAENSGYFETLQAPYIAGFSERLAKDLNCINVGVTSRKVILCPTLSVNSNLLAHMTCENM